jgi:hypothetical protein
MFRLSCVGVQSSGAKVRPIPLGVTTAYESAPSRGHRLLALRIANIDYVEWASDFPIAKAFASSSYERWRGAGSYVHVTTTNSSSSRPLASSFSRAAT